MNGKKLTVIGYLVILPNKQIVFLKEYSVDKKLFAFYKTRAVVVKAMAHPVRLYIVDELSRGEKCVCELTELIEMDMSTVSKHLSVLKNAGIVQDEKRGTKVFYILRMPCVMNFFDCVDTVIKELIQEQLEFIK